MTLIIIVLTYPSIHNSLIAASTCIELQLAQHMVCAMYVQYAFSNVYLFWGSKGVMGK